MLRSMHCCLSLRDVKPVPCKIASVTGVCASLFLRLTKKDSTALDPTAAASALSQENWMGMDPSQMTLAMGLCGADVVEVLLAEVELDETAAGVLPCAG